MPDQPRRRGRILFSLLFLLFGVGVVPLIATSYKLVSKNREILELDQKQLQLDKARSLSQQVGMYLGTLRTQVGSIARTLEIDVQPGQFGARVQRIGETKALTHFMGEDATLNSVSVIDVTGAGARAGIQLPEPDIEQLLKEAAVAALQEGRARMTNPVMSTSLQEPVVVLGEPIKPNNAGVQGAVLAVGSLGPLWGMTHDMAQGGLVDVYVVDGRGRLVAHSNPKEIEGQHRGDFSDVEIVKEFIDNKGAATATMPFTLNGVKMLGTYARIPDTDHWGVIVHVDQEKAYHAANQMWYESLYLVVMVTALAVLLGTLFAGQISQPIRELARGARELAGGDYSTRVSIRANNEVAVLGDAFNQMGEEIQKAIEQIRKAAAQNKELFLGSIRMLANAIDEKDPYTRGHSERVAYYSMIMAKHMGMSEQDVENVHLSGIIHDVGKIGIEDKILRKPAALTDDEYEIMKQHPKKGEHILDAVPLLKQMAGPGLMHHENWDGSGYPEGLKAEQIPLLGRIVSVADAFDAMTTDRPYSKAMTFEKALERLRFLAGKKFDPLCVDAIEKASAAGDLTPAKAKRAAVAARQQPPPPPAAAAAPTQ